METVAVVLSVGQDRVEEFEAGFREHELPVWRDLQGRGLLVGATLNRLDISSRPVEGAVQYLVVAIFATGEGHHAHDDHPGFSLRVHGPQLPRWQRLHLAGRPSIVSSWLPPFPRARA